MTVLFVAVIGELFILFLISRILIEQLYAFFFILSRSRPAAIAFVTLLTFPGTVIHELSHLFTAEVLGVHTGNLQLAPEAIQGPQVRAGSVMVAKTDPFRRTLIGTAPLWTGLLALSFLAFYFTPLLTQSWEMLTGNAAAEIITPLITVLVIYLMFAISNSMFSSKDDMKGFPVVAILLAIVVCAVYFSGIRISITGSLSILLVRLVRSLAQSLGIVLAINVVILLITRILIVTLEKITKRTIRWQT